MTRTQRRTPLLTVFLGALGSAFGASLLALYSLHASLPESDGAASVPFLLVLLDPFVLSILVPISLIGALLGFPIAAWATRATDPRKSMPIIVIPTLIAAFAFAPSMHLLASIPVFVVSVISMFAVRAGRHELG